MQEINLTIIFILVICGLMAGSLLNVFIYRIPIIYNGSSNNSKYNLFWPRSQCRNCSNTIRFLHNIPIISYIILKGKCAYCERIISSQYPLVELITMIFTIYCGLYYGLIIELIAILFFLWVLIIISFIDINHKIIPDSLSLTLLWAGLLCTIIYSENGLSSILIDTKSSILGVISGYLVLWFIYHIHFFITKKEGLGYGDFKLLAAIGAWVGWQLIPMTLFFASILGLIYGLISINLKRTDKDTPIPFGPFLAISGWISLVFGAKIITIYSFI